MGQRLGLCRPLNTQPGVVNEHVVATKTHVRREKNANAPLVWSLLRKFARMHDINAPRPPSWEPNLNGNRGKVCNTSCHGGGAGSY